MGLRNDKDVVVDDGDGGGSKSSEVPCSICLEVVADGGDRSWAKLQCGHRFHLDCIGSAFNVKGAMQCPNCRKIEKGQWLHANGSHSIPDYSMEDWTHDEDLYDFNYSQMSFGVHWCPFGQMAQLPSSFENREFPSSAYQDLPRQHAVFSEHTPISSPSHSCPYITHLRPILPSSPNSSASVSDSSNSHYHWNGPSVPSEVPNYAFRGMDLYYHSWERQHRSLLFSTAGSRIGGVDQQPSIPPVAQRPARSNSHIPRLGSFIHPYAGHSSGARLRNSVPSSMTPPYLGSNTSSMTPPYLGSNTRARDRGQALQAHYQQQQYSSSPIICAPVVNSSRRPVNYRGTAQPVPAASSSDQNGGFCFFPSGRSFQEAEVPAPNCFQAWERDWLSSFSMNQVDQDMGWGAFHRAAGGSDAGMSPSAIRQSHGSERTSQHRS